MKDMMGTRIKLGDTIVYPARRGSALFLRRAVVCEVPGKGCSVKEGVVGVNPKGRRVIVSRIDNCAVVARFED
jgi:hypothetical protein